MNYLLNSHPETVIPLAMKKLDHDFWIELESTYPVRIVQRQELFAKHGSKIIVALPGSEPASRQVLNLLFLVATNLMMCVENL